MRTAFEKKVPTSFLTVRRSWWRRGNEEKKNSNLRIDSNFQNNLKTYEDFNDFNVGLEPDIEFEWKSKNFSSNKSRLFLLRNYLFSYAATNESEEQENDQLPSLEGMDQLPINDQPSLEGVD